MAWIEHNEEYRKKQKKQARINRAKNVFYIVVSAIALVVFMSIAS